MNLFESEDNMNITIVVPGMKRGGAERVVAYIANSFIQKGNNVNIIVLGKNETDYYLEPEIMLNGLNADGFNKLKVVSKLRNMLNKISTDVILCFSMKMTIYAILATIGMKVKIVGSDRSNPYYAYGDSMRKGIYAWILSKANGFIFLTEGGKNYYPESIRKKSIVIPNGVFAAGIPSESIAFNSRDRYMICAVGRFSPVKDYETMLTAFSMFLKTHPKHKLHIYGDGELRDKIIKFTHSLKIEKSVVFEGIVNNIPENIKKASMFIHTSKSESWCNALMEAMACGIPSVAMDCDFGPRSMIVSGINGELVSLGNVTGFVDSMTRIANSDDYAMKLSCNAAKINTTHSSDSISKKYLKFIKDVFNG
jgi:GalNAc-alpha-(1->4)-GalNAc-alpha-(1->3)-diNAcBac-PP-undecaprenol alpha-1,4-N-acetyl-D-galactosaminyltransferase